MGQGIALNGPARWILNANGDHITGACDKCGRIFPAIGLIPVDQWAFGHHVFGWFCAGCRPRGFGRINGTPSAGWVMLPSDGSPINPPKAIDKLLRPMGSPTGNRNVQHRIRKPKVMRSL